MVGGDDSYLMLFVGVLGVALVLVYLTYRAENGATSPKFVSFQREFLAVYGLLTLADWLQGPYAYSVYKSRGFGPSEIGKLFVCGYASSLVLGTWVGSLADSLGRKKACLGLCVVYGISCVLLHAERVEMLVLGRVLGGISASLLGSAPEAWMLHEHNARGFTKSSVSLTTSLMSFTSGMTAILAGVVATPLVSRFGPTAPTDASCATLIVAGVAILSLWPENRGSDKKDDEDRGSSLWLGVKFLGSSVQGLLLALIVACFEGAMFLFVFAWSPTLQSLSTPSSPVPNGIVFATFMAALMAGAKLFELAARSNVSPKRTLAVTALVATLALATPALLAPDSLPAALVAMCVFEACCGAYFPSAGTLRSIVIPGHLRATVASLLRVGLNLIVVTVLAGFKDPQPHTVLVVATSCLAVVTIAALLLR